MKINKNKFKRPQNERKKNYFHVCEIKVSSSFISGWFVEPRRLRACVYMKNMSRTLLLLLRSFFFSSLIHSEIFIHHSRFFSSFRSLNITNYNSHDVYILQINIHKHAGIINLCEFLSHFNSILSRVFDFNLHAKCSLKEFIFFSFNYFSSVVLRNL